MSPLPAKANRGHNSKMEKVVMSEIDLCLPIKVSDLVYKFQIICLKETKAIEWKCMGRTDFKMHMNDKNKNKALRKLFYFLQRWNLLLKKATLHIKQLTDRRSGCNLVIHITMASINTRSVNDSKACKYTQNIEYQRHGLYYFHM